MKPIADVLQSSRLFSRLSPPVLVGLLEQAVQVSGQTGSQLAARPADVVIVLEGGLEMKSREGKLLASVQADQAAGEPGILHVIPPGAKLTLTRPSQVLILDGDQLDGVLAATHSRQSVKTMDDSIGRRVSSLVLAAPFAQMTLDQVCRCAEAMTRRDVAAGEEVIRYADRGDYFYVIESGEAEVWRHDPLTGEGRKVATLEAGAHFGEEALLSGGLRNATVRMSKPGSLLCLSVADFDRLVASHLVNEIAPEAAHALLARRQAQLIDCRYPDEHEMWRIPGSRLIPLDRMRQEVKSLDGGATYIVYCRTGRRSRAAVFLLREQGINAMVLRGGIAQWGFDYEGEPVTQTGIPPI
jgi:rhodanese-related sulfurtransferase